MNTIIEYPKTLSTLHYGKFRFDLVRVYEKDEYLYRNSRGEWKSELNSMRTLRFEVRVTNHESRIKGIEEIPSKRLTDKVTFRFLDNVNKSLNATGGNKWGYFTGAPNLSGEFYSKEW